MGSGEDKARMWMNSDSRELNIFSCGILPLAAKITYCILQLIHGFNSLFTTVTKFKCISTGSTDTIISVLVRPVGCGFTDY